MAQPSLSKAEFLTLSTKLCEDFKVWLSEAVIYHTLTKEDLLTLNQAAEIIEKATLKLTAQNGGVA